MKYEFDTVRWLRNVAEVQSHRAGAGPAMLRENMLKCAEEIDALRARVARLEEALRRIAYADRWTWEKDGADITEHFQKLATSALEEK